MKRAFLVLTGLLLCVSVLFAGGSKEAQSTGSQPSDELQKIDLTVESGAVTLDVFLPFGSPFFDGRLKAFKEANPNIQINSVDIPGNHEQKLLTMAAAGNAPDVFVMGPDSILKFMRQGALLNLDNYFYSSEVVSRDDMMDINDQVYAWDGKSFGTGSLYGFASGWSPDLMLYYNKSLFDAAGVDYPSATEPMTWDEFRDVCEKVGQKDSSGNWIVYPALFDHVPIHNLYGYIMSNGGKVYSEDNTKCVVADDPATREAISYWMGLQTGSEAVMPYFEDPVPQGSHQLFQSRKLAMTFSGGWAITAFWNQVDSLDWGIAPAPMAEGGERVEIVAGMVGQVISSSTRYPKAAWKLFEFLLTEDQQQIVDGALAIPINKAYADKMTTSPALGEKEKEINEFMVREGSNYARLYPRNPYVSNSFVDTEFRDGLREVYMGTMNLDSALRKIQDNVNAEISDWL